MGVSLMNTVSDFSKSQALHDEIAELEWRLEAAKCKLNGNQVRKEATSSPSKILRSVGHLSASSHHFLLLLSDSALPLGSFAFSSGLESYLAHTRPSSSFPAFLGFSLSSYASTTLPFVLAAHRNIVNLVELDDTLDAAIMCTVGRRASVAQGRALLSIWDRSFSSALPAGASIASVQALKDFTVLLRGTSSTAVSNDLPLASAHLGPLFGAIACIFGPYHAQKLLASVEVQQGIQRVIDQEWNTSIEDAGQSVPVMDLWIGRHEMLYSRIFNS